MVPLIFGNPKPYKSLNILSYVPLHNPYNPPLKVPLILGNPPIPIPAEAEVAVFVGLFSLSHTSNEAHDPTNQDPPCTLDWGYMVPTSGYLGPN